VIAHKKYGASTLGNDNEVDVMFGEGIWVGGVSAHIWGLPE